MTKRRIAFISVGLGAVALIVLGIVTGNLERIHTFSAQI